MFELNTDQLRETWQGAVALFGGGGLWELRSAAFAVVTLLAWMYWQRAVSTLRARRPWMAALLALRALGTSGMAVYFGIGLLLEAGRGLTFALAWANLAFLTWLGPQFLIELLARGDRRLARQGRERVSLTAYARSIAAAPKPERRRGRA